MSRRPTRLQIDDMIERIERIERSISGLEHARSAGAHSPAGPAALTPGRWL